MLIISPCAIKVCLLLWILSLSIRSFRERYWIICSRRSLSTISLSLKMKTKSGITNLTPLVHPRMLYSSNLVSPTRRPSRLPSTASTISGQATLNVTWCGSTTSLCIVGCRVLTRILDRVSPWIQCGQFWVDSRQIIDKMCLW